MGLEDVQSGWIIENDAYPTGLNRGLQRAVCEHDIRSELKVKDRHEARCMYSS